MIPIIGVGNKIIMKKTHPCGGKEFVVLFAGSDVKVKCCQCGRELIVPRVKLEKNIKDIVVGEGND